MTGEPVELTPKQSLSVALVLHELATNAAKYGTLSQPSGRLAVSWTRENGTWLRMRWRERNGPEVTTPNKAGFGTTLIRKIADYDLEGEVDLTYDPQGVTCELAFPLTGP